MLAVTHAVPIRYLLRAADGLPPQRAHRAVRARRAVPARRRPRSGRAVEIARGLVAASPPSPTLRHNDGGARPHRRLRPRARPDPAGRRGRLPRLGRRGLDLPLARAPRARLRRSRACTCTTACAARRRTRTRGTAVELLGAEVIDRAQQPVPQGPNEAALRELRYRRDRAPLRLRATGHTATDQVETVLHRLARERPGRPRRIKRAPRGRRRTAAARRLARGDRGVLPRARPAVRARTRPTPDTKRGLIRSEMLPAPGAARPARRAEPARARRRAPAAAARRSSARCSTCSPAGTARRRPTSAAAVRAVREYDTRPARGRRRVGPVAARDADADGLEVRGRRAGRPARGPAQEGAGSVRGRQGAARGARRLAARRARRRGRGGARASRRRRAGKGW